jgi:DNA-directed RNA polymerase subunit L
MTGQAQDPVAFIEVVVMEIEVLTKEKNSIEVEFKDLDHSILQLLVERLNQDKDVEFVSFKVPHPVIKRPRFILKTRKKEAVKLLEEAIEETKNELDAFRKKFAQIVK